ncbi:dihydroneopterin aldolase [Pseudoroseomonas globiformis]|uniref:dihydroneopterin aldolase n=1 Tax=Teichococcus globiformis TaxID=2307229 RepID=A0ABV7G3Y7_9PROT
MTLQPDARRQLRRVFVRGLTISMYLGVYPHEISGQQRVTVGIDMLVREQPSENGVGEDHLSRVVDYDMAVKAVHDIANAGHINLAETFAEKIAAQLLAQDARIVQVQVRVEKPDAIGNGAVLGVAVERVRSCGETTRT